MIPAYRLYGMGMSAIDALVETQLVKAEATPVELLSKEEHI